jgi:hypothetical protein
MEGEKFLKNAPNASSQGTIKEVPDVLSIN